MQITSCHTCGESLSGSALQCINCGTHTSSPEDSLYAQTKRSTRVLNSSEVQVVTRQDETLQPELDEIAPSLQPFRLSARANLGREIAALMDEVNEDERVEQRQNWQKMVEPKTPSTLSAIIATPTQKRRVPILWPRYGRQSILPGLFFWLGLIIVLALLLGGMFGVALTFGRVASPPAKIVHTINPTTTLQASPTTISLGGIVTLRGSYFLPNSQIALTHDKDANLVDTGGSSQVQTDSHGSFSDTIIINPSWTSGVHALSATNRHTHQQASFSIAVIGQSALQGPPHLLLSAYTMDLGVGDETTNSNKLLALSNAGGGQVSWQTSTTSSWLQISPQSGSIPSGGTMSAIVATERAALAPGSYDARVVFNSNTEQITLDVKIEVIPLQPEHQATLQLSSVALTFTNTTNNTAAQSQAVMLSNPGILPLNWKAALKLQNGSGWLDLDPWWGNVNPGAQQLLTISTFTRGLAPGVYKGMLTFSNAGSEDIQGNNATIYISLTVTPMCTLVFKPGSLSFTATAGLAVPTAQALKLNVVQGCTSSQPWSASATTTAGSGNWIKLSSTSGTTPNQLQVSVNSTGLAPGTYTGTVTFMTSIGSQIVPITLTLNSIPCALGDSGSLQLQGTSGQTAAVTQSASLTTTGNCPNLLNWTATSTVTTPSGGTWLSATPTGTLIQPANAPVSVQASLLGLAANTYTGIVTVTAIDSVTNLSVGTVHFTVTLTVLAPCTLQAVSATNLTFTATTGANPTVPTQTVTIGATGNCAGNVTIAISGDTASAAWLAATPATSAMASGAQTSITVTITSSTLTAASYTGTITLTATDSNGAIAGSSQTVTVSLKVK